MYKPKKYEAFENMKADIVQYSLKTRNIKFKKRQLARLLEVRDGISWSFNFWLL